MWVGRVVQSYLQDLGDALLNPRELIAMTRIEGRSLAAPGVTVFITVSGVIGALWAPIHSIIAPYTGTPLSSAISALIILGSGFLGLLCWILIGALLHAISKLIGGEGGLEDTLRALGYSTIGYWVTVPLTLAFGVMGIASSMIGFMAGLVLGLIWHLYSLLQGLSEAHGYSTLRAFVAIVATLVVPLAVLALLSGIAFLFTTI